MDNCLFCKIIKGEIPSSKVYEDDKVFAFKDIDPKAPVHILIVPKEHISTLNELNEKNATVISHIFTVAASLAKEFDVADSGYRVVSNCGENGGQSVFHIHFHLLGGRSLSWPPG